MTTLPCTWRPACSSTAARICSTGKRRRDGHPELARRDQAGDLFEGARGGVGAVRRRDPVDLRGDGGDALVRDAEFSGRLHRVRPVQVDRRGDAAGSEGADPVDQAVAVGDRLGPEGAQGVGRRRRPRPDHPRAGEPRELDGEHADPASRAADEQRVARAGVDDGEGGGGRAARDGKGGGGAVVDAVGGVVRVAARRDGPGRVDHDVVGDRAGQGAAEHPVADREPGHAVTDLVHDAGVVGPEPARQAQAESGGGVGVGGHEPVHRVQAGRGDPHADLPRAGLRRGHLAEGQDLRAAERLELDRSARGRRRLMLGSCMLSCLLADDRNCTETDYAPFTRATVT